MDKIENLEQLESFLKKNPDADLFIFKRSTRCPTSFIAFENFRRFHEANPTIPCAYVNVIEERAVSNHLAELTGVEHHSPQVLHFRGGKVIWNGSHHEITEEALTDRKQA